MPKIMNKKELYNNLLRKIIENLLKRYESLKLNLGLKVHDR